ncbi:SpvB/TcaC N-terminal domain-containing protein [Marinobacter changyiensis]|uniref:SpvB/TcaC N-terminal domain-containing protein n=1 Tax=Marinobacter changyiensis TaxID=2604091 RepID=UPI0015D2AA42|nr:SpvB/TcaC N-terminal domain-containing protein [Marinobacter changyiensis]
MSNKSGTSEQVISLPNGGGAQSGIGETFSPDLHTGTGNFTVPIALPPGRNGFQPELKLVYSTGNGNGPFGLGWSLSIPGVSRETSKGIPRYQDGAPELMDRDVFILSGAEGLVRVSEPAPGTTRYQPRTEGLFARIEHHQDVNNDYWRVRSKDGLISWYGTEAAREHDPATVADPDTPRHVFNWRLTRTEDAFGNRIVYDYERDRDTAGPHHWDQLYLHTLRYADFGPNDAQQFLVSVTFIHEERPDPFSAYRAGFEIRTRRRCTRIEVRTHAHEDLLARTYDLVYLDQRPELAHLLPLNRGSLLSQVVVTGHTGDAAEQLPSLEFGYTRFEPENRNFFPIQGPDLPARSLASPDLETADLFGNGLPDVLQMNGTVRYWRNLGDGRFDLPRQMRDAPAGLSLADPGVQLIDADGDGRIDLLATDNGLAGYFPLNFDGTWNRRSFRRYDLAPSFNLQDPEVALVDLDGDGVTDAVRSGSRLEYYFNDPQEGWNDTRRVARRSLEAFPDVHFADPRVKWADMTGDGLQDLLLVHDGNVEYWPNLGYGDWGRRVHMHNSPRLPYGYDPRRILIGDVDGDGLADLVYVDHGKILLWINQSGNGWSDPIEIDGTPAVTDMDAVRLVDLLGAGISGVLWSADARAPGRDHLHFLDFTGGLKPYLLADMDNHMGAVTRVEYAPSTRFYLADQQNPDTRWQTPLPFPVQVVACVEIIDQISRGKLTTEYLYHHGYWDGAEREFRGFGMVEQFDTETFEHYNAPGLHGEAFDFFGVDEVHYAPPMLTKTWFHQGPIGEEFGEWNEADYHHEYWAEDPPVLQRPQSLTDLLSGLEQRRDRRDALRTLRGSVLRTELYALDGSEDRENRPYTVTEAQYSVREESPPGDDQLDRKHIFFSHPAAQRTTQWERGADPMTQLSFTDQYDGYGQPRRQVALAVPRGRDYRMAAPAGEPYLGVVTNTNYAQRDDNAHYMVNRVARTTAFELRNDGSPSAFALWDAVRAGTADLSLIAQSFSFYDGAAFEGLPLGQLGDFGALSRSESLVLTEAILEDVYRDDHGVLAIPPYLDPNGPPLWTAEYPPPFRAGNPTLAGYVFHDGSDGLHPRGFYAGAGQQYDFQLNPATARGLLVADRDPLGRETVISYDPFDLLPVAVTDPVGLTTSAGYDYRAIQPERVTDANGNRIAFAYTPLGLLASTAVMGKEGETVGDTPAAPGKRLEYDFLAFEARGQPVAVRTIAREHHATETNVPLPERDATIETVEYSDGFGRLLQSRTQAEEVLFGDVPFANTNLPLDQTASGGPVMGQPADPVNPRVVVSGWQIYNNKGQVVEKYEPFFDQGWAFEPPQDARLGQSVRMFYDPRGQVIRTLNPGGSEHRVIYGAPPELTDPDRFAPTPWEAYTYDANDLAPLSEGPGPDGALGPLTDRAPVSHHFTPGSIRIDALGRTVESIQRNRSEPANPGDPLPPIEAIRTQFRYDIRGNLLVVTDALDREAFVYAYDLANNALRVNSIDAGLTRTVLDAAGRPLEQRDSKGTLALNGSDEFNRPNRMWVRDGPSQAVTLRQRLVYGDSASSGLTEAEARARNLLGQLVEHYDEAGQIQVARYDFKGNLLERTRRVVSDAVIIAVFDGAAANQWQVPAFRMDWQPPEGLSLKVHAATVLDPRPYTTTMRYDALNRATEVIYPEDVIGQRSVLVPGYNRSGGLEQVTLNSETFVEQIAYNARGQRTLIAYGNGVMTRYAYDPLTFHLGRLRSEHYTQPADHTYLPAGAPLQDFGYEHDLVGNITDIHDRTPASGIPDTLVGTNALDRAFTYDAIYQLRSATGREQALPPPVAPWGDFPKSQDMTLARAYTERYRYDAMGSMEELRHITDSGGFTRDFIQDAGSNRLVQMTLGQVDFAYTFDPSGNMTGETTSRHFEWNHSNQMRVYRTQTAGAEPSIYAHYLYDSAGIRVKKLVRRQGGAVNTTVYIDGILEHHAEGGTENNSLHVMDDQQRIALVRVGPAFPDDATPAVTFHLGDHLGSSNVVVDGAGIFVNREEYTPYGETSFGSFARKRYRITGKERDEESGLSYHGARYYAPWIVIWFSADPVGAAGGFNLYRYAANRPTRFIDANGHAPGDPDDLSSENIRDPTEDAYSNEGFSDEEQEELDQEQGEQIPTTNTEIWERKHPKAIGIIEAGSLVGYKEPDPETGGDLVNIYTNRGVLVAQVAQGLEDSISPLDFIGPGTVSVAGRGVYNAGRGVVGFLARFFGRVKPAPSRPTVHVGAALATATARQVGVSTTQNALSPTQLLLRFRNEAVAHAERTIPVNPPPGVRQAYHFRFGNAADDHFKGLVDDAIESGQLPNTFRTTPRGRYGVDVYDTATGTGFDLTTATVEQVAGHDLRYIPQILGGAGYRGRPLADGTVIQDVIPLVYRRPTL